VNGRYWCELAWLGGDTLTAGVLVDVSGDRIAAVHNGTGAPAGAVRLDGITLPGLANVHSHAFHRALRGRTHRGRGTFWTWRDRMYEVAERLDPESYLELARATYAEMALAGMTTVGEFHYLHHAPGGIRYSEPNVMSAALAAAATEAGVRLSILDTCYLSAGVSASGMLPLTGVQQRFGDGDADAWAGRVRSFVPPAGVRTGAAIHSVRAVDPAAMRTVAAVGDELGVLHVHVSEQQAENEACQAAYGCSPTQLLADAGALGTHSTLVHATHLSTVDGKLVSGAGSGICLCPTTERDLADGIGTPAPGIPVSLGSDSHAVIDLFEEARAVELDERLRTGGRGHRTPAELMHAATEAGHRALGWPDAGRIATGALADLVTVDTRTVRLAGAATEADGLAAVVFAGGAADVRHVVVGGRRVVADGTHLLVDDVPGRLARAIERMLP
jgi:formiminoglutamate deiminase